MNCRVFGLAALLAAFTGLPAQNVLIRGRIVDSKTKAPVISAKVSTDERHRTVSNPAGSFVLAVEKLPVILSISHVSYGVRTVRVRALAAELVISLDPVVNQIPEVRISGTGNRLRILNRKARYTIIDYQFQNRDMWFIGCVDNSPLGARLYLGSPFGDTVCSVPIKKEARLYRDFFGNIHLAGTDSVHQLFRSGDSILLLYPERRESFMSLMSSYEVAFGDGLARLDYNAAEDLLCLVYKDSVLTGPRRIFLDSREEQSYLEKKHAWIGRYFGSRTLRLVVSQQKDNYLLKMRSSLFAFQDTLYVINLKDNQLHAFGPDLNEFRVVPITFHFRETDDITDAYMPFRILTDRVRFRAYVVFHLNSHYSIFPLNTETGLTGPELVLPRYSAMDKISIHDNILYYIYPEKVFPYYQRLFSMSLD